MASLKIDPQSKCDVNNRFSLDVHCNVVSVVSLHRLHHISRSVQIKLKFNPCPRLSVYIHVVLKAREELEYLLLTKLFSSGCILLRNWK